MTEHLLASVRGNATMVGQLVELASTDPLVELEGMSFLRNGAAVLKSDFPEFPFTLNPGQMLDFEYKPYTPAAAFPMTGAKQILASAEGTLIVISAAEALRSVDGGMSWQTIGVGIADMRALATDDAGVWMIVGAAGALAVSADDGLTWFPLATPISAAITAVATDKKGRWVVNDGVNIRWSDDDGRNWSAAVSTRLTGSVTTLATDGSGTWVIGGTQGLHRSVNNAAAWSASLAGVSVLAAVFGNGIWVVTGTGGDIRASTNAGVGWTAATSGVTTGLGSLWFDGETFITQSGNTLLTSITGTGTWTQVFVGAGVGSVTSAGDHYYAVSGSIFYRGVKKHSLMPGLAPADQALGPSLIASSSGLFAGWLKSADFGETWYPVSVEGAAAPFLIFAISDAGIGLARSGVDLVRSVDGGDSWQLFSAEFPSVPTSIGTNHTGIWLAGGKSGYGPWLRISEDDGANWRDATTSLPGGIFAINRILFAGSVCLQSVTIDSKSSLIVSLDSGDSWRSCVGAVFVRSAAMMPNGKISFVSAGKIWQLDPESGALFEITSGEALFVVGELVVIHASGQSIKVSSDSLKSWSEIALPGGAPLAECGVEGERLYRLTNNQLSVSKPDFSDYLALNKSESANTYVRIK